MMDYTPERIWATGNGETGSWNAIEGRMKSHMPDGWQTEYVRATDYDALAAKLAEADERIAWLDCGFEQAMADTRAAEAALPAVYQLGVRDGATHIFSMENDGSKPQWMHQGSWAHTIEHASHRAQQTPTPTAAELMARIQTGENK